MFAPGSVAVLAALAAFGPFLHLPPAGGAALAQEADGRPGAARPAGDAEPDPGWNSEPALAVARRAIDARRRSEAEASLRSFTARAEGHVYFLGEFAGERRVARADQIALRIRWRAPGRSVQTIVGRRHETRLPTRIRYHLDHLSVVLDNFDDRIRLGEGEEVRHVLHPAAPGAPDFYDYRLADSLEIRIGERPIRVYRLDVRPRRPRDPGLVGTLYVERGSGAIARLAGTFTSSAYVDSDLDYIQLDLRSALWDGRHWLPAEQELEIRRQVSWLDYPIGGIIRTRFRIFDYRLNADLPPMPPGDRVTSAPPEALREFAEWRSPLGAGPVADAERDEETLEGVRRRAHALVRERVLPGTSRLQLHFPGASGALRARRAEGVMVGAGARFDPSDRVDVTLWGGWAFARELPEATIDLGLAAGPAELRASLFANRLADVGPWRAAPGLLSSLAFAADGEDWTDPYFEAGGELAVSAPLAGGRAALGVGVAEHSSALLVATAIGGTPTRPVRPIQEGTLAELRIQERWHLGRRPGTRLTARLAFAGATAGIGGFGYTRALGELEAEASPAAGPWSWSARLAGGVAGGALPPQRLLLLGGRGTVPGYSFRAWAGDRAGWARVEAARDVVAPWLRLRVAAAAGWTELAGPGREAADRFGATQSEGVRPALGVGAGLFWDILRLDLFRGLDGGEWTLLFSIDPDYWDIL